MTVPPGNPVTQYSGYDRQQPARITGVVRTRPGVWRIAWGVCLGMFLFAVIATAIVVAVGLTLGVSLNDDITIGSHSPSVTSGS
jgi:hypothetical protein